MRAAATIAVLLVLPACEQRDPLFCGSHMDDPRCSSGDAGVPEGYVVIGGNVTGLTGSGLILSNNAADDKLISSDGAFSFATPLLVGATYDVTVTTQPTNPSNTCIVTNGAGTAATDVLDIDVTCMPAAYEVGGSVAGFPGSGGGTMVLTNNGVDDKPITTNGPFTFATQVPSGQPYNVAVKTQPTGTTCNPVANMGIVGTGPVSTVVVVCGTSLFTVGGTPPQGGVYTLNGTVKLKNANDTITINANGSFAFPTPLADLAAYNVSVTQQPAYPPAAQTCALMRASGNVNGGNVSNVRLDCVTRTFTVGGNVSGLNGTVVLKNGADTKSVSSSGAFTFTTAVASGTTYAVSVMTQPTGQVCSVTMGSGTVANGNVTNVAVSCINAALKCGATYCGMGSLCCDPEGNAMCKTSSCSSGLYSMACDDRQDCSSGRVCCTQRHNGSLTPEATTCENRCSDVQNGLQMCASSTECSSGKSCKSYSGLPGYKACQ